MYLNVEYVLIKVDIQLENYFIILSFKSDFGNFGYNFYIVS